jgi:hypothetical protein
MSATIMTQRSDFARPTQLSRHGFVSRALFGSRVRATEAILVKAYLGFDLLDNSHAVWPVEPVLRIRRA